jgi:hypothetical protein
MNLKLNPITLDQDYASKINESCKDFVLLCGKRNYFLKKLF